MKKFLSLFCTIFMATLILAGCSSSKDTTKEEEEAVRTVSTVRGDVEVPTNPKRVIATYGMGDILALGVKPVSTYDAKGSAYEKEVEGLPVWENFEPEEIMQYDPDLILVISEEKIEEFSKIAPTIYIPFTTLSMEERITFLGEVLNKKEEASKVLFDFKEKITDAKEQLVSKEIMNKKFSIFEGSQNGGIWVYGDKWGRGGDLIYSQLGLKAPDVIKSEIIGKDQYREVSLEAIKDYAGDYIIFSGEIGELENNPVWKSIPAVKAGHVIPIDFALFFDIDIYSSGVQLDYIMDKLLEN
jgi:iron complex transport system substrate-binding protein